jgi:hypothetical protein
MFFAVETMFFAEEMMFFAKAYQSGGSQVSVHKQ